MSAEENFQPKPSSGTDSDKVTNSNESETDTADERSTDVSDTNIKTVLQTSGETEHDDDKRMPIGPARFNGRLLLKSIETGKTYVVENDALQEVLIGRLDRATGFRPTVDLTELDGRHRGVSRRHATIHEQDTVLMVTDHNSMNGTYLNGDKLVPEQRRLLRHGDVLRIGKIELRVVFEK